MLNNGLSGQSRERAFMLNNGLSGQSRETFLKHAIGPISSLINLTNSKLSCQ